MANKETMNKETVEEKEEYEGEVVDERLNDPVIMSKYRDEYSDSKLWTKIKDNVSSIGLKLIYRALQLYYVTESENCPQKVKMGIFAALGYLISPIDFIPDFTPIVGYADDAAAVGMALILAQAYITEDVKAKARGKIQQIFGMKAVEKLSQDED